MPIRGILSQLIFILFLICFFNNTVYGDKITIAVGRDFYDGPDSRTFLHGSTNTWEALTYLDDKMRAIPWLAKSWTSEDNGKKWIFYLRENVKFHDGTLLTSSHVVTNIKRIMSNPKYDPGGVYKNVETVYDEFDNKVIFYLKEPIAYFPKYIAYYGSPVLKPSVFQEKGQIKELIGTGPYKILKIIPSNEIQLLKNDNYWGNKPLYSQVIFKKYTDAQSRLFALIKGEVDAIADVGAILPDQVDYLKKHKNIVVKKILTATTHYMIFNNSEPPFSDEKFRLWFSNLVDRENIIKTIIKDNGIIAYEPFTILCSDYVFSLIKPEKNKIKIDEIKGVNEINLILSNATIQRWPYQDIAMIIQQKLKENGIKLHIKILENAAYHESIKKGKFNLAIQPFTLMTGDPDFFYSYWFSDNKKTGFIDEKFYSLISKAKNEGDISKRKEYYRQIETILAEKIPILPLYHDLSTFAVNKKFSNFELDFLFRPCLTERCKWN